PVVAETIQSASEVLEGHRGLAVSGIQAQLERERLPRPALGADAAENGRKHHRLYGAGSIPQRHAKTAVVQERKRVERKLARIHHHGNQRVTATDECRRERALECRRENRLLGEPLLLPDEWLPEFVRVLPGDLWRAKV